jgi:hypothetical protein
MSYFGGLLYWGGARPHAIRILARAWIRVVWRARPDANPYNPEQHTAARAINLIPEG